MSTFGGVCEHGIHVPQLLKADLEPVHAVAVTLTIVRAVSSVLYCDTAIFVIMLCQWYVRFIPSAMLHLEHPISPPIISQSSFKMSAVSEDFSSFSEHVSVL